MRWKSWLVDSYRKRSVARFAEHVLVILQKRAALLNVLRDFIIEECGHDVLLLGGSRALHVGKIEDLAWIATMIWREHLYKALTPA